LMLDMLQQHSINGFPRQSSANIHAIVYTPHTQQDYARGISSKQREVL
jgi:hypothetical protein